MNNLTNAEIARIFGMYLGHEVYDSKYRYTHTLEGVSKNVITKACRVFIEDNWHRVDTFKLLLTHLSKITDEHAIEIANIAYEGCVVKKVVRDYKINCVTLECMYYDIDICTTGMFDVVAVKHVDGNKCTVDSIIDIIDRLRELGYALPYKGKSLFELGIAIDATTLK